LKKIGDIQLFAEIKRSEHGSTYRGMDTANRRRVLVKTFVHRAARDAANGARSRFEQEAAIYAQIDHPNVVKLLEYGISEGTPFLALEFIEGFTLRTLLQQASTADALPPEIALAIFCDLLEGVEEIHRRGFIHRDLKPENVLVGNDGSVKICDFDLAIRDDAPSEGAGLSGTAGYVAPEAILGEPVTAASDLFSLGVILYEMLAGARPFQAGTASGEMNAIVKLAPVPLSKVNPQTPAELEALVDDLLAKNPQQRIAAAREALARLNENFEIGTAEARRQMVQKYLAAPAEAFSPDAFPVKPRPHIMARAKLSPRAMVRRRLIQAGVSLAVVLTFAGGYAWRIKQGTLVPQREQEARVSGITNTPGIFAKESGNEQEKQSSEAKPVNQEVDQTGTQSDRPSREVNKDRLLAPAPVAHPIIIQSHPWAYLFIDGDSVGATPLAASITVREGSRELTFKNPEFPALRFTVAVDAQTPDTLTFSLWEQVAQLEVLVTPWADLFINGERRELPAGNRPLILQPGKYHLRFVHPQLGEKNENIFLRAGEIRRLEINMF
jgi:serine/threonine-protein kinase